MKIQKVEFIANFVQSKQVAYEGKCTTWKRSNDLDPHNLSLKMRMSELLKTHLEVTAPREAIQVFSKVIEEKDQDQLYKKERRIWENNQYHWSGLWRKTIQSELLTPPSKTGWITTYDMEEF